MARKSLFPPVDLHEALTLANAIWKHNAGQPMRRLTLFDELGRSPSSSTSRNLVTASSGYGLTQGGYSAEMLALTERGRAIVERNDAQAKLDAVLGIEKFRAFFENYRNATIPSETAALDFLKSQEISEKQALDCLTILLKSGEQVALIQEISGIKRIVSAEHALETLVQSTDQPSAAESGRSNEIPDAPREDLREDTPSMDNNYAFPDIHIDVQIHISADASAEQIDQIFASMARHLGKRGSK